MVITLLTSVYLVLHKAAGTVIPSFSFTLFEGGVSPEEEYLVMWASAEV